jgi:hypothetical protein
MSLANCQGTLKYIHVIVFVFKRSLIDFTPTRIADSSRINKHMLFNLLLTMIRPETNYGYKT